MLRVAADRESNQSFRRSDRLLYIDLYSKISHLLLDVISRVIGNVISCKCVCHFVQSPIPKGEV